MWEIDFFNFVQIFIFKVSTINPNDYLMKTLMTLAVLFFAVLFVGVDNTQAQAPKFAGIDKSPLDMAYTPRRGAKTIKVIYSRPYKNDRDVFGGIVKYDKVWRAGANEATEIHLAQDVKMAGKDVKAGVYQLFIVPGKDKWTVILNSEKGQWGAYQYKEGSDVAKVEVPVKAAEKVIENFSVSFADADKGATMFMGWDKTYVEVPFEFSK